MPEAGDDGGEADGFVADVAGVETGEGFGVFGGWMNAHSLDLDVDTMGAGVDVESLLPQEADKCDAGGFGVFDGQAGGWTYGRHYCYASDGGFLDELEAGAAAEQEDRF